MIAEFSVTPIGSGVSVREAVAKAVQIVHDSGLTYELNPMGTVVEGTWDEVFTAIRRCQDELLGEHERLSILIKVDVRRGPSPSMESKVDAVRERLRT